MNTILKRAPGAGDPWIPAGTWSELFKADGSRSAMVGCGECGKNQTLTGHTIAPDGSVTPSLQCSFPPCPWHVYVTLEGWGTEQPMTSPALCVNCKGDGILVGYGCPGFRRIETPCKPCGGTGQAPSWQAEAVGRGRDLRAARMARKVTLREEAHRLGLSPVTLSDAELGHRPVSEWPDVLRGGAAPSPDPQLKKSETT